MCQQAPGCRCQFVVFRIPDRFDLGAVSEGGEVSHELAKSQLGRFLTQLTQEPEQLATCGCHGSLSPTVGRCPTGVVRSSITSTRTSWPGSNLATRLARVTPS